jgi:hypothetical protein
VFDISEKVCDPDLLLSGRRVGKQTAERQIGIQMNNNATMMTLKFEQSSEQQVGFVTRVTGLVRIKHLIPLIDELNLQANPRDSKVGPVTADIRESLTVTPEVFPFKSKGILLAASDFRRLDRGRYGLSFADPDLEGILDGGHNTLAIGLHILELVYGEDSEAKLKPVKLWQDFKELWDASTEAIAEYRANLEEGDDSLDTLVPVELLVPVDPEDAVVLGDFNKSLLDICSARNNNVQLRAETKANAQGLFDNLKDKLPKDIADLVEWRTNDGGEIKVTDVVALTWIPLRKMLERLEITDEQGKSVEPVNPTAIYSSKGECMSRYEKLMSSPQVTIDGPRRELRNNAVLSALELAGQMPAIYDLIYELFPDSYNKNDGKFGRITPVKKMNASRVKQTKFGKKGIAWKYPDGYIVPLVAGLEALIDVDANGHVSWKTDPIKFIKDNIDNIVENYKDVIEMVNYDPQKVGKASGSYRNAYNAINLVYLSNK